MIFSLILVELILISMLVYIIITKDCTIKWVTVFVMSYILIYAMPFIFALVHDYFM